MFAVTTLDLDAGIRNNAGDAQIVALLLADELVGNSHMTCTVRGIAEAYLTGLHHLRLYPSLGWI
jgi:hypothetical protein